MEIRGTLQERVNYVLGMTKQPEGYEARPELYAKSNLMGAAKPEETAFMFDHDPEGAPPEYRRRFIDPAPAPMGIAEFAREAGFPAEVANALPNLSRPIPEGALEWGRGFHGEGTPWLWLTGGTGAGKTCAAAVAAHEAARHTATGEALGQGGVAFVSARELTEIVDGCGNYSDRTGRPTKREARQRWVAAGLLVLDDLGLERHTATSWDTLSRVLRERAEAMRPTVVTCPYSGKAWFAGYRGAADPHEAESLAGRIAYALRGWDASADIARNVIDLTGENMRPGM